MRGEHFFSFLFQVVPFDSSPLARGAHALRQPVGGYYRFIPSCEGNTRSASTGRGILEIHPLLRGEHFGFGFVSSDLIDSSPLARGTRAATGAGDTGARFIPSCEGNTIALFGCFFRMQIHPLLRGEHFSIYAGFQAPLDSSPLARGRRCRASADIRNDRFIPPCEGKTGGPARPSHQCQIHPPLRGEDISASERFSFAVDSSPLARGRPPNREKLLIAPGFIPPCEGKTSFVTFNPVLYKIHPPLRGEDHWLQNEHPELTDSSPLARGRQYDICKFSVCKRFIPPCEGKTKLN